MFEVLRYYGYFLVFLACLYTFAYGIQQEFLERTNHTPPEWTFKTRKDWRWWKYLQDHDDLPKYYEMGKVYQNLVKRLEDPDIDGADLKEQGEIYGIRKRGYDITAKSEAWRQGYFQVLMATARIAEYLNDWVMDISRGVAFPRNTMIGPSNPHRKPIHPSSPPPPREENCKPALEESPDMYYMQILTTKGFTERERLEATLAYAAWLEYKNNTSAACEEYQRAIDIAVSTSPHSENPSKILDPETHVLKAESGSNDTPINTNIVRATTEMALHKARTGSKSTALPILLSILRARRSAPDEPDNWLIPILAKRQVGSPGFINRVRDFVETGLRMLVEPEVYPLNTDKGIDPPARNARGKCEEAALMTYIGEILYASAPPSASTLDKSAMAMKEQGIAWSREAVDIAEEHLWGRQSTKTAHEKAQDFCKECLRTGLENWSTMIEMLVEQEKAEAQMAKERPKGWFGGGGRKGNEVDMVGRWESEDAVVKERFRRAQELLDPPPPDVPASILPPIFQILPGNWGGLYRGWLTD